ncbi:MAG: S8 family serine peptidase [Myxococcota bacterium]
MKMQNLTKFNQTLRSQKWPTLKKPRSTSNTPPRTLSPLLLSPLLLSPLLLSLLMASPVRAEARLDVKLQHMLAFREGRLPNDAVFAPRSVSREQVKVLVVFRTPLKTAEISELEKLGVRFQRHSGGEVAHVDRIYGVELPWTVLPALLRDRRVEQVDAAEGRARFPTLDLSMPEIGWSDLRYAPQVGTEGLTGRGVLMADFDTSMDPTHPALLKPDGGLYEWLDLNGDGRLTLGADVVDLNGDGKPQTEEALRLLEAYQFSRSFGPQVDGQLDADEDWLYADTNQDATWDAGADAGYTDSDPGFGEPIFVVEDLNGNGTLDLGEGLVRLKTSKLVAALDGQNGKVEHLRGQSLLSMAPDPYPHGTSVAGILVGEQAGRRWAGVATEAELLSIQYDAPGIDLVSAMSWAKTKGADLFLWEFGEWTSEFLDGTSALEQAVTSMAGQGVPQICPSGNIGQENKHGRVQVTSNGGMVEPLMYMDPTLPASNVVYMTGLWRQQNSVLSFSIAFPTAEGVPSSKFIPVTVGQTTTDNEGNFVTAASSKSSKNTNMLDLILFRKDAEGESVRLRSGQFQVRISNSGTSTANLHIFLSDDLYGWSGGAVWESRSGNAIADPNYSVSMPGTADGCITVGSYATRTQATVGQLSTFSGRGPRIDEQALLDVAAPGNYDVYSPISTDAQYINSEVSGFVNYTPGGYWQFGGTSAASAHVAGVVALLKQQDESRTHAQVEADLRAGALADSYTGTVPNNAWGMGKLRVGKSLLTADKKGPTFEVQVEPHPLLEHYLVLTVVPSERLSGAPKLTGVTGLSAVTEVGEDVYQAVLKRPSSGNSLSVTVSASDLAGNAGSQSSALTF